MHRFSSGSNFAPLVASILLALSAQPAAQQSAALFDAPLAQLPIDSPPFRKVLDLDADGFLDAVGARMRTGPNGNGDVSQVQVTAWTNDQTGRFLLAHDQFYAPPPGAKWSLTGGQISVGDQNGDGRADFVWCAEQGGQEVWSFLAGAGGSFTRTVIAIGTPVVDVELADFDADGLADLAVLTNAFLEVRWASGGAAQIASALPCCTTAPNLLVVETDGDALPDLFVGGSAVGRPYAIESNVLSAGAAFNLSYAPSMWADGDVDSDGDEDLVAFHMGNPFGVQQVLRRSGPTSFTLEPWKLGGPAEYLADTDADGDLDGVCCGGGGCGLGPNQWPNLAYNSKYELSVNDGSGSFSLAYTFWNAGSPSLAGAVDVDHDGDADLVAGRTVYYSRGNLATPYPTLAQGSDDPRAVFDWDGDGDEEPLMTSVSLANWYRNQGDGSFGYVPRVFGGVDIGSWIPPQFNGDFDGDGDPDIARRQVQSGTSNYPGHLWRNNGGGAFPSAEVASDSASFFFGSSAPGATGATDLDMDGDLDAWNNDYNGYWDLYQNAGNGWFDVKQHFDDEEISATADFDQDGWMDLAVSKYVSGVWSVVKIRHGSTSGLGPALDELPAFQTPVPVGAVGDFNADGRPDLAYIDDALHIRVFTSPRTSSGAWGDATLSTTAYGGFDSGISAFDVDGDLRDDLVVGSHSTTFGGCTFALQTRDVYLQNGGPAGVVAFQSPRTFVMSAKVTLDLDGDGDRDLIGRSGTEWYVHRNMTTQGIAARRQFGVGTPGGLGAWPTLGASGPFEVGANPALRLTGAQPGSKAFLAVGLASTSLAGFPFPGMSLYVDPFAPVFVVVGLPTPGAHGVAGSGHFTLPVTAEPSWIGLKWYHQAFPIDLGAPNFVSATNALELVYGP
jgi:hypothetical protein